MNQAGNLFTLTLKTPLLTSGEDDCCSIPYFRAMLVTEIRRMTDLCDDWEQKLEKNREIISDVIEGEIRCVIGQSRLIMSERFSQFSGLVNNCEYKRKEKKATFMDLKGFWEMIYFQVEDVDKKFAKLEKVEKNDWVDEVIEQVGVTRKRAAVVAKKVASAGLKALIAAKRRKGSGLVEKQGGEDTKEAAKEMDTVNIVIDKASDDSISLISPEKTFDGGFFSVKSPARQVTKSPKTTMSTGCDRIRKSVLTESAKRVSGLVSPFVSQVARRAMDNENHSLVKDSRRSSLFDDDFDQENDAGKVSPVRKVDAFSAAAM